jgi:hypothetical protein
MYGLTVGLGPIGDSLSAWLSPSYVPGVVILGLFLVLHIVIVRSVVRPLDGLDRVAATRGRSGRRAVVGRSHLRHLGPQDTAKLPIVRSSSCASRDRGDVR